MAAKLFDPVTLGGVTFRNRVAVSPMCMHSATADGRASSFHVVHYGARALGGAGLVMLETAAVLPNGVLGVGDLGVWDDAQVDGLRQVVGAIHQFGARAGAQIGHTGRKLDLPGTEAIAPSPIRYDDSSPIPVELTHTGIDEVVHAFGEAARRVREAGFDVLEVHAAHGYLLNEFLSPLSNKRSDEYGAGSHENRYRILRRVLDAVRAEWGGALFVRVSSTDYIQGGNTPEDFVIFGHWMKEQGVHLIDASSGGTVPVKKESFPGFQVPAAEKIRREVGIATGAVGLVQTGRQAEEIIRNGRADLVFVGREMLKDPFWARTAADDVLQQVEPPAQYTRYGSAWQRTMPAPSAAPLEVTVAAEALPPVSETVTS